MSFNGTQDIAPVVIAEPRAFPPAALELLRARGPVRLGPFDREGLVNILRDAEALIVRLHHKIDAPLLEHAPMLRAVATATTGLSHIDIEACRERNVKIVSLRGAHDLLDGITATSELALALMVALARSIIPAVQDVRKGVWNRDAFKGRQLNGQTLGIVGLGRLGRRMAAYGQTIGMTVVATDPSISNDQPFVKMLDLEELAQVSDVIALFASYEPGCGPILTREIISLMRDHALIVNTARGELVDELAIADAIKGGGLGGYGADVLSDEQNIADLENHPLIALSQTGYNVVITPHIGGATHDAMSRVETYIVDRLIAHLDATRPANQNRSTQKSL